MFHMQGVREFSFRDSAVCLAARALRLSVVKNRPLENTRSFADCRMLECQRLHIEQLQRGRLPNGDARPAAFVIGPPRNTDPSLRSSLPENEERPVLRDSIVFGY